jgi:hypothetical protein
VQHALSPRLFHPHQARRLLLDWSLLDRQKIAATPNCEDRLKRVRQIVPREPCPSLSLRSAFRWIAFVPLYQRKALLAGPVHDNKKHANTDRPH